MNAVGIIPARYHSSRFEGKVLEDVGGKPMIQLVYERAGEATRLDDLIVATDDHRIVEAVKSFGGKVVLTRKEHSTGTDRLTEVVSNIDVKVVANIQADEPLLHPSMIDDIVSPLLDDPGLNMATLMKRIENEDELTCPHVIKVVTDKDGFALYFSRASIPYSGRRSPDPPLVGTPSLRSGIKEQQAVFYKHIGLYAYTKDFLLLFMNLPMSTLEGIEGLEQLRALENGYRIKVVETKHDTIGVDTPEDLERVRKALRQCSAGL